MAAGLAPHDCRACGTCVLVKKNSRKHTSIQWVTDAVASCPVFAERAAEGANTALLDTCERLTGSIAAAVEDGTLEVSGG
ncbi:hypothetical protein [Amycolatopsis nigrescens]|uniref:hypothetical protein n=1 Tax=Amycolatopsis nigrescens TaxID=381445 RepID=UPI000477E027|nr:hypothetical protein [Amycolatopsis nigrescens]